MEKAFYGTKKRAEQDYELAKAKLELITLGARVKINNLVDDVCADVFRDVLEQIEDAIKDAQNDVKYYRNKIREFDEDEKRDS